MLRPVTEIEVPTGLVVLVLVLDPEPLLLEEPVLEPLVLPEPEDEPVLTLGLATSPSFFQEAGPTYPSTVRPYFFWKLRTAPSVPLPKIPSVAKP